MKNLEIASDMIESYKKLCQLAQENLHKHDKKATIHFEQADGLSDSIFSYPQSKLLSITDNEIFIRECFYKILDRPVDDAALKNLLRALRGNKLSKLEVIQTISDSLERRKKQTGLQYE